MATISLLSALTSGVQRQVNLAANTLSVLALEVDGTLLSSSITSDAGSTLIGDDDSYSNFTPTSATVKGALAGIDSALTTVNGANTTLSNLVSPTSINQDLLPSANLTRTLGSNTLVWNAMWIKELLYPSAIDFRLDTGLITNGTGSGVLDLTNTLLTDNSDVKSVDWTNRLLSDSVAATQLVWSTSGIAINTGLALNGSTSGAITQIASATTTPYSITWPAAQAGASGDVLTNNGSGVLTWTSPAATGVTSVALFDGSTTPIFAISGSPVTSTGTLTFTLETQGANMVLAGPATGSAAEPTFRSLVATDIPNLSATYVLSSLVGADNGVASLDASGKIPVAQLPSVVMEYQGAWDPTTNTPTLVDGTGTNGSVYRVDAVFAGPIVGLSDSSMVNFQIGNLVIYNGTVWQQVASADGVTSVNGSVGAVTVNAINQLTSDVTAGPASGSASAAATIAAIQGKTVSGTTGTTNVVFSASPTLTGTLTAATITASGPVTGSNLSGTNTGDQTITLTGDVTGSGTGSFATTISTGAVTAAKLATVTDGVTLDQSGAGATLEVKALGIGTAQLAAASVTAAKLGTITDGVTLDQSGAGSTLEVKAAGISATQLATGAFDQVTIVGGAGTAASVAATPATKRILIAGQSFTANTSYLVRFGLTANSETAGRIYAADITTSSFDLFWVIGIASSTTAVSSGGNITVTTLGSYTLASADTAFISTDPGKPVWLTALGTFSTTAPGSSGNAVAKVGIVTSTTSFDVLIGTPSVF